MYDEIIIIFKLKSIISIRAFIILIYLFEIIRILFSFNHLLQLFLLCSIFKYYIKISSCEACFISFKYVIVCVIIVIFILRGLIWIIWLGTSSDLSYSWLLFSFSILFSWSQILIQIFLRRNVSDGSIWKFPRTIFCLSSWGYWLCLFLDWLCSCNWLFWSNSFSSSKPFIIFCCLFLFFSLFFFFS